MYILEYLPQTQLITRKHIEAFMKTLNLLIGIRYKSVRM